jgi:hypothetical protein
MRQRQHLPKQQEVSDGRNINSYHRCGGWLVGWPDIGRIRMHDVGILGESVMEKAIMLIKLEHGGYVVKQHDPFKSVTPLLFAGTLNECLGFLQRWMEGE